MNEPAISTAASTGRKPAPRPVQWFGKEPDCTGLALNVHRALLNARLPRRARHILEFLLRYSLDVGRASTFPVKKSELCLLTGISDSHIDEPLAWLHIRKLIMSTGDIYTVVHPVRWQDVPSRFRDRHKQAAAIRLDRNLLQACKAVQQDLIAPDPSLGRALQEVVQLTPLARSLSGRTPSRTCEHGRTPLGTGEASERCPGQPPETGGFRDRAKPPETVGLRPPNPPHAPDAHAPEKEHGHVPWGPGFEGEDEALTVDERQLLGRLQEAIGTDDFLDYRRSWVKRVSEGPRSLTVALDELKIELDKFRAHRRRAILSKGAWTSSKYWIVLHERQKLDLSP